MRQGRLKGAGVLGLLAAITACQSPGGDAGGSTAVATAVPEAPGAYVSPSESATSASTIPVPRKKPTPPPAPLAGPEALMGIDERETMRLLGPPERIGEKPPAIVWTYSDASCTLDLFFYMNMSSQTMRSLTYEFRGIDAGDEAKRDCLRRVRARRVTNEN